MKLRARKTSLSANETTYFSRAEKSCGARGWYIACFSTSHENETFNSKRAGVAFLTVHASARERKSLRKSANTCWAESLTLFSTGFGFWGLARTSPQFFVLAGLSARIHRFSSGTTGANVRGGGFGNDFGGGEVLAGVALVSTGKEIGTSIGGR